MEDPNSDDDEVDWAGAPPNNDPPGAPAVVAPNRVAPPDAFAAGVGVPNKELEPVGFAVVLAPNNEAPPAGLVPPNRDDPCVLVDCDPKRFDDP